MRAKDSLTRRASAPAPSGVSLDNNPTSEFLPETVQCWFGQAGCKIDAATAQSVATELQDAKRELVFKYLIRSDAVRQSFDRRKNDGSTASLRTSLKEIGKAANDILAWLEDIRWEILSLRIIGERHRRLEQLHQELHGKFLYGQWRRFDATEREATAGWAVRQLNEEGVGASVSLAPSWLEDALQQLAQATQELGHIALGRVRPTGHFAPSTMRAAFVGRVATAWHAGSGREATVMSDDNCRSGKKVSGFRVFHRLVCGHVSTLLPASSELRWSENPERAASEIAKSLRELGLNPVPSSTTLSRYLSQSRGHPGNDGTKLDPALSS